MSLPEVHLAGEAVAALIDDELSRGPQQRALDHLARCRECWTAVTAQRQAKAALVDAGPPAVPGDLFGRLCSVPMTTDLDGPGTLAVDDDGELGWVPGDPPGSATQAAGRRPDTQPRPRRTRPRSYPVSRARSVRLRRGLAGTLAGLAFGVVSAAAPLGSSGANLQQPGVVNRERQVVPAGVGFTLNLAPGAKRQSGARSGSQPRSGSQTGTNRSVRPANPGAPVVQVDTVQPATTQPAVANPR